jgi:hypothetical protein
VAIGEAMVFALLCHDAPEPRPIDWYAVVVRIRGNFLRP